MSRIAFIPVRGGSKSIPLKNIKMLNGKPLVYWTAKAANDASCIDSVVIATDSEAIREAVRLFDLTKVVLYDRDAENAQDTSSTESVVLEYLQKSELKENDEFFLIQATSPLLRSEQIEAMYEKMTQDGADSALSCVRTKRFFWSETGKSLNYDYRLRPRRQDFDGLLMENGACYINKVGNILRDKNRLSEKISIYEMPDYMSIEIDEPDDFILIEHLMKKYSIQGSKATIKCFLTDCDGVLTDGGMYYSIEGELSKKFNTKDGMGFELLKNAGIIVGIITGEQSELVKKRADKLHVNELHMGIKNKHSVLLDICKKYNINFDEVAYIGDDINDIEVLKKVGFPACPADAINTVKAIPNIQVLHHGGGTGCVREFADFFLTKCEG